MAEDRLDGASIKHVETGPHRQRAYWSWDDRVYAPGLTVATALAFGAAAALAIFGLPPVDVHGPWHYLGVMDPLCGMTRAVRLLALGRVTRALDYNPASPLLGAFGVLILIRAGIGWATGRWLRFNGYASPLMLTASAALIGLLWAHQQMHAALLMHT